MNPQAVLMAEVHQGVQTLRALDEGHNGSPIQQDVQEQGVVSCNTRLRCRGINRGWQQTRDVALPDAPIRSSLGTNDLSEAPPPLCSNEVRVEPSWLHTSQTASRRPQSRQLVSAPVSVLVSFATVHKGGS
jgi:hypothetical protein